MVLGLMAQLHQWRKAKSLRGSPAVRCCSQAINHHLYEVHGFHGNRTEFHSPDNSCLNKVHGCLFTDAHACCRGRTISKHVTLDNIQSSMTITLCRICIT